MEQQISLSPSLPLFLPVSQINKNFLKWFITYLLYILSCNYLISGFFPITIRQPCGPISAWCHFQRNRCPSKTIIKNSSNPYSAFKEDAKERVECILNTHQDIFEIHYSLSLPLSIPSTEMAAAPWNLPPHPTLEARPKTFHNMQPVWLTHLPSSLLRLRFSIM